MNYWLWTDNTSKNKTKKSKTAKDYLFLIRDKSATQQIKISTKILACRVSF